MPEYRLLRRQRQIRAAWIFPIFGLLAAMFLGVVTSEDEMLIRIGFDASHGLRPNISKVLYNGIIVGRVVEVGLSQDLRRVKIMVRMNREGKWLMAYPVEFWVDVDQSTASSGGVSASNIMMATTQITPGYLGKLQNDFVGLEYTPVLRTNIPGRIFLLKAHRLGNLTARSPVKFKNDLEVGEVLGWDISLGDTQFAVGYTYSVTIHAFIRAPFYNFVYKSSRFWVSESVVYVHHESGKVDTYREPVVSFDFGKLPSEVAHEQQEFSLYDKEPGDLPMQNSKQNPD